MFTSSKQQNSQPRYYRGLPDGTVMVENRDGSERYMLPLRLDLSNHSPTGFSWGYSGSGPTQLALALCADVLGDDVRALKLHQRFKFRHVAGWPADEAWGPISDDEIRLDIAERECA
jgi:hypothetical protein